MHAKNVLWILPSFFAHYPFCSIHDSPLCKILCSLSSFLWWWQFVCRCMGFVAPWPLVHPQSVARRFRIMFLCWWGFSFACLCHWCLGSWVFRTRYEDVWSEWDTLLLHTPCNFSWVYDSIPPELGLGVFACRPCLCQYLFSRYGYFLCVLVWGMWWLPTPVRVWEF